LSPYQRFGIQLPRARCTRWLQNSNDLAREAVSWNTVFGAPVVVARVAGRMRRPHLHTLTTSTTGVRSGSRTSGITPCITGFDRNHTQHTIRLSTTSLQHYGPSYQAGTTGNPHHERSYHAGTTGFCTTKLAQRAFRKRNSPYQHQKRDVDHARRTPNDLRISCKRLVRPALSYVPFNRHRSSAFDCAPFGSACRLHARVRRPTPRSGEEYQCTCAGDCDYQSEQNALRSIDEPEYGACD